MVEEPSGRVTVARDGAGWRGATGAGSTGAAWLDAAVGVPARLRPVAGFGRAAGALEQRLYAPARGAGARFAALATGASVAAAIGVTLATRRRPWLRAGLVAV